MKRFVQDHPEARVRLACLGGERLLIDGVLCLPLDELLRANRAGDAVALGWAAADATWG